MTPFNYAPFVNFGNLSMLEDSLNRFFTTPAAARPWTPAVDILENEQSIILKADLPDMNEESIAISIENGTITLKGERKLEKTEAKAGYHRIERSYGSFARNFVLPDSVDAEHVSAEYKNGTLTVTIPKLEVAKPRKIEVKVS